MKNQIIVKLTSNSEIIIYFNKNEKLRKNLKETTTFEGNEIWNALEFKEENWNFEVVFNNDEYKYNSNNDEIDYNYIGLEIIDIFKSIKKYIDNTIINNNYNDV